MKDHIEREVVTKARASLLALAVAVVSSGCSSPPPAESTPPPASAAPTGAAQAGSATPAAPGTREGATPGGTSTPAGLTPRAASPSKSPGGSPDAGGAAASPAPPPAAPPAPAPPPPPRTYTLAADRPIAVYNTTTLSTKTNEAGEKFSATLAEPITDGDWVIAKKGARVQGVIVDSDPGEKVKGVASITIALDSLTVADGRTVPLATSHVTHQAKTTKGKDAKKIGIGAGAGAAIGAIAGGGKGAAIGAGVGGAAGTGAVLATRGDPAVIAAETRLGFKLKSPVTITERQVPSPR